MTQVFIVGFGKFGNLALAQWRRRGEKARIWIIDHRPEALSGKENLPGIRVLSDGPQFLTRYQESIKDNDWIIPALPIHLAWKWLTLNLRKRPGYKTVVPPGSFGLHLPYCQQSGEGLFLSYADFICPENCPAPLTHCFKTKKKRTVPLWKFIADQRGPKVALEVIESRQLAPGVGGFPFGELRKLQTRAQMSRPPFFVATACRCHGVIHGLTW